MQREMRIVNLNKLLTVIDSTSVARVKHFDFGCCQVFDSVDPARYWLWFVHSRMMIVKLALQGVAVYMH